LPPAVHALGGVKDEEDAGCGTRPGFVFCGLGKGRRRE
jgi:hypothetical protein